MLVGHSLGCRVILELLMTMNGAPLGSVLAAATCLMAAVPVDMVEERWPQLSGIALPARNVVLFSEDDWILAYAFPPGETLAGEGFLPRAVGRFGEPRRVWTLPRDLAPNGHGDYWRDDRAAAEVGRLLGGAVPTAPAVAALAERALAEPVPLSMRSLATRELPARELQTS